MKRIKIILPIAVFFSGLILGCNRDSVMPQLNVYGGESLRSIDFSGISRISGSSGTRGFNINASYDAAKSKNIGSIAFATGSWSSHPPKVIFVVKDNANNKALWAKELSSSGSNPEYQYKGGANPEVRFNANIKYSGRSIDNQTLSIYIFDSQLNSVCEKESSDYNVTIDFPSLTHNGGDGFYSLKPASAENQKLIFSTSLPIKTIVDNVKHNKRTIISDVKPLGTIILFSLRNVSDKPYNVDNDYLLRFKTNGFSFENTVINGVTGAVSHRSIYHYSSSDDRRAYGAGSNNKIDYNNVLGDAYKLDYTDIKLTPGRSESIPAMQKPNTYHYSNIYVLYVMPTSSDLVGGSHFYNMLNVYHPYFDNGHIKEDKLFNPDKLFSFYDANHKALSLIMDVPSGSGSLGTLSDFGDSNEISNDLGNMSNGNINDFNGDVNEQDNDVDKNEAGGKETDFKKGSGPDSEAGKDDAAGKGTDFGKGNSPENEAGKDDSNGGLSGFGGDNTDLPNQVK